MKKWKYRQRIIELEKRVDLFRRWARRIGDSCGLVHSDTLHPCFGTDHYRDDQLRSAVEERLGKAEKWPK